MNKQTEFISKSISSYIKGIAILLMFMHHLFAFPERMPSANTIVPILNTFNLEQTIGLLGKYCVPMFLFLSGYGFSIINESRVNYYLKKVFHIYVAVFLVFIVFIPLARYGFELPNVILHPVLIFLNFSGLSSSYNGEWWFIFVYVFSVSITPLLQMHKEQCIPLLIISIVLHNMRADGMWGEALFWFPAYVFGFCCAIYSEHMNKLSKSYYLPFYAVVIWFGYQYWNWNSMVYLVPLVIILFRRLYFVTPVIISQLIIHIGRQSLFMWLIHSFYCYYFFKEFIYYPKYSMLILLNLLICTYVTARVFNFIYKYVIKSINNKCNA